MNTTALVLSTVALAALLACGGGADGSQDLTTPADGSSSGTGSSGTSGTSGSSGSSGSSSGTSGTSSTDAGTDSGDASTNHEPNAFTGAAAFVAKLGGSTLKTAHPFTGRNPAKHDCLDSNCHGPGGDGPTFVAGGSVFQDVAGTKPAAQIEVRLRDAAGKSVLTNTDANGNFYVRATTATAAGLSFPVNAGARSATATQVMTDTIPAGNCNSSACHGGKQGWIHVP
jgi:hypothetical protein